jgi:hypothetical protein
LSVLDDRFAEWYDAAQVEVTEERYKARRGAIGAVAKVAKSSDLDLLVRLAHKRPVSEDDDAEALERFREPFLERDASFGRGKKQEMAVLAGATLAAIITGQRRNLTVTAALAVESADFLRWKGPIELSGIAGEHLAEEAIEARRAVRESRAQIAAATGPLERLAEVAAPVEPGDFEPLIEAFKLSLTETVESIDAAFRNQAQRTKVLDEELDFFWWLQHKASRRAQKLWSAMSAKAPALLAAVEAADMTAFVPGPRKVDEYLDQVITDAGGDPAKSRAVSSIVNESRTWLRDYQFEVPEGFVNLLPLHSCLKAFADLRFKSSWTDVVESATGFKAATKRSESDVAAQAYSECLLLGRL